MKSKFLVPICVVAIILVGGLVISRVKSQKEPIYRGRNLSEWVHVYFSGYSGISPHASSEEMHASEVAIRAMGTNTIPVLIKWLQDGNYSNRSAASTVFEILGEKARPATPMLVRLTKDRNEETRFYAFQCLLLTKPDKKALALALIPLVHDEDKTLSMEAAEHLIGLDIKAAKQAGVFVRFPQLRVLLNTNSEQKVEITNIFTQ